MIAFATPVLTIERFDCAWVAIGVAFDEKTIALREKPGSSPGLFYSVVFFRFSTLVHESYHERARIWLFRLLMTKPGRIWVGGFPDTTRLFLFGSLFPIFRLNRRNHIKTTQPCYLSDSFR